MSLARWPIGVPPVRRLTKALLRFLKAEDGPTAVEYAVMLAMIIVVCVGAVTTVGTKTSGSYTNTNSHYPAGS
jgi:pilus assembly protein Flp/PilA